METFPSLPLPPPASPSAAAGAGAGSAVKKRRIPKACAGCRISKLRCDGGKPCARCRSAGIVCDFVRPILDPVSEKLARIEAQMEALKRRVPDSEPGSIDRQQNRTSTAVALLELQHQDLHQTHNYGRGSAMSPVFGDVGRLPPMRDMRSPVSMSAGSVETRQREMEMEMEMEGRRELFDDQMRLRGPPTANVGIGGKRKRGDFELNDVARSELDFIGRGLISFEDAVVYFRAFFQGCDKYVPVFDSKYDTFESVRERSSMLFDVICAVGCRAECGPGSEQFQTLSNAAKSPLCDVILGVISPSIETVQALLVHACYWEKGWLLTSMAVRMSLDLGLPGAYNRLCTIILDTSGAERDMAAEGILFRRARVWFGTFILEHILSIDCGKKPGIKATSSEAVRRVRVLLRHPNRTPLDFRLFAQVELNSIRAHAHERLTPPTGIALSDDEMNEIVQGTRIDLSVWFSDWVNLVESTVESEQDRASLIINLRIQRDWGEMTMLCKGLQGRGIDNVAIMSDPQRNLIHLAIMSAQRHLSTIIENPELYIATLRYGMDFVWAKCAFSVLLLLRLAHLLPPSTNMSSLISDAKILLRELSKVRGSSNIYYRILCLTVEKCEKVLNGDLAQVNGGGVADEIDAEVDFQSYVPKEFILEWNFPGLTFCWMPFDFQDLFMDFGNGLS